MYFAIPKKLLKDIEHIPEKAGILVCEIREWKGEKFYVAELERKARVNKADKLTMTDKYELARLGALRVWNLKKKLIEKNHIADSGNMV